MEKEKKETIAGSSAFSELDDQTLTFSLCITVAVAMPLPPASVDVVVCDVPFGRKFGCGVDMATALPDILSETER